MIDLDELLGREIFAGLTENEFARKFEDEVGELALEKCSTVHHGVVVNKQLGRCELYEVDGGLVVLCSQSGRWSLFETAARAAHNDHIRSWADFSRGVWLQTVPTEPGYYFVRSADGRRAIHELRSVNGRLVDVSGGYVAAGKVTEWRGDWWHPRLPSLPESF